MEQVEGHEDELFGLLADGRSELADVCQACLIGQDHLTVDYGSLNIEGARLGRDRRVFRGPVMASPGEDSHGAIVDDDLGPVAVELDLVNPVATLGRLAQEGREHGLDEAQGRRTLTHQSESRVISEVVESDPTES